MGEVREGSQAGVKVPRSDEEMPEDSWPTPVQWRAWFLSLGKNEQVEAAARALHYAEVASTCFVANHESAVERIDDLGRYCADLVIENDKLKRQIAALEDEG